MQPAATRPQAGSDFTGRFPHYTSPSSLLGFTTGFGQPPRERCRVSEPACCGDGVPIQLPRGARGGRRVRAPEALGVSVQHLRLDSPDTPGRQP